MKEYRDQNRLTVWLQDGKILIAGVGVDIALLIHKVQETVDWFNAINGHIAESMNFLMGERSYFREYTQMFGASDH